MNVVVILNEPQDVVNIAVTVRAMLNFGQRRLRLVAPAEFDARRIEGIAHKSGPLLRRVEVVPDLDAALADCTHVVGMTARGRTVKRNVQRPAEAVADIMARSDDELVGLLFGREDKGLSNHDLDRCHRIVTIETDPEYPSLNLGQAATIMLHDLYRARAVPAFKPPKRPAPPATRADLEAVFADAERALEAIEFFKSHTRHAIMRAVREIVHRTPLDQREANLIRAMSREVVHYLVRTERAS